MSDIAVVLVFLVLVQCIFGVFIIIDTFYHHKFIKHRMEIDNKRDMRDERAYQAWLDSLGEKK